MSLRGKREGLNGKGKGQRAKSEGPSGKGAMEDLSQVEGPRSKVFIPRMKGESSAPIRDIRG